MRAGFALIALASFGALAAEPSRDAGVVAADVDREALAAFVRSKKPEINACYDEALKKDRSLRGRVVVFFTITPAGRASEVRIDEENESMRQSNLAVCLRGVVLDWAFPFRPPWEVPVAYPFVFAPAFTPHAVP